MKCMIVSGKAKYPRDYCKTGLVFKTSKNSKFSHYSCKNFLETY